MAEIKIRQVAKQYGSTHALHSIDLEIADQEFLVLLGASGCGKTTLLRIVAGLETATSGEVWIGDKRVDKLPPRDRNIAMVFQNYAVFPHLTVFENIAFGLRMAKLPQTEVDRRVTRTAELMHIEALLKRYSGQLSGGQRQRVAVARALAMEPEVLLMDEPLSNLDALLRMEMRAELKTVLAESKTTTIYVTHDQVEAMSMADRIAIMNKGEIVQASSAVEVYRNPAAHFVGSFIGNPPMNFLDATSAGEGVWNVAGVQLKGPVSTQKKLQFGIRPEDIIVHQEGSAEAMGDRPSMVATVRVLEPLGSHLLASCRIGDEILRVVLDSDAPVKPGDELRWSPAPDRIRWFDPASELAVA
ncbi:MAG: ABC transporter ATP-binding protein [Granulosicoccus sp.]|nr:ABC transporter ATP-binding protein [Granulosicoccus sp.]